ncbi:MAG: flagellar hook-associated protein FlgK [Desulfobacterales bacterium]
MSGIGTILNIAATALNAQQNGIGVTAHNIANVNTEGYSRQRAVLDARQPGLYGGLVMGRGVEVETVSQYSDKLIENRLMQEESNMSSASEMEKYMQVMEGLFNENSDTGISTMLSDFWNGWYDISNNPSGASERILLYEHSSLITEQFNTLASDLNQIETDLTNAVSTGLGKINDITNEIAQLNDQIVGMEANGSANDLRDKRNTLVSELNEYLDIKSFEQSNGSLTIVSAKGCTLVQGGSNYELEMGGTNGDRVIWQNSSGSDVDVTNYVSNGKLGGWLDTRDEVVAKYQLDLDALAKEFIWSVNQQHSQGVGLEGFSSVTGSYQATDTSAALNSTGLGFADKIVDGDFRVCLYDSNGNYDSDATLAIDADLTTIDSIVTAINGIDGGTNISATVVDDKLQISSANGYTFAFSDDNSNVLAALGINTFFIGSDAAGMGVNDVIGLNKNNIAAAQISSDGAMASGNNANALAVTDLQNTALSISQSTCDRINGNTQGSITSTIEGYYHSMVGSIGIASASVSRDRSFSELMVNELSNIRDSISAVSLDEEMTNLIAYQHAYAAAAKLISVSDEMLKTLLEVK